MICMYGVSNITPLTRIQMFGSNLGWNTPPPFSSVQPNARVVPEIILSNSSIILPLDAILSPRKGWCIRSIDGVWGFSAFWEGEEPIVTPTASFPFFPLLLRSHKEIVFVHFERTWFSLRTYQGPWYRSISYTV
jgi:hypothetical protein